MSARDVLRLAWANLNRMRARVALTCVGVIIGTVAIIILISLGVGLQTSAEASFGNVGDLTVIQINAFGGGMGAVSVRSSGSSSGDEQGKLDQATLDDIRALPHVVAATPILSLQGGVEVKVGQVRADFAWPRGVEAKAPEQLGWKVEDGVAGLAPGQMLVGKGIFDGGAGMRFGPGGPMQVSGSGDADPRNKPPEKLVGRTATLKLTKSDEEGKEIVRTERLRIVGVLESDNESTSAYISLKDADDYNRWFTGKARNTRDGFQEGLVKVDSREAVKEVQDAIKGMGLSTFSMQEILSSMNQVFVIMQAILGGVGAIALLVAAIGIANTMTMAIFERTKEIGIMKALGATNNDVLRIFLTEAGAIGLLGGLVGTASGWGLGKVIDFIVRQYAQSQQAGQGGGAADQPVMHYVISPLWLLAFALGFATLIGLISGAYPALRAASMKPLKALRTD